MKSNTQFFLLLAVVLLGVIGATMPYLIFSPLFLKPIEGGLVSTHLSLASRSFLLGIALAAYPFGQFLGSPILGSLSDKLGRKKVLITSLLCTSLCFAVTAFSIVYHLVGLLIVSRFVAGFFEGIFALVQASIADLAIEKNKGFGSVSAMASTGYIFGPFLGGVLSDSHIAHWFNFALPFFIASGLIFCTALGCKIWLKETLISQTKPDISFMSQFNIVQRFRSISQNQKLKRLLIAGFFTSLAIDAYYEFYPALLVTDWHLSAFQISFYNISLSLALGIGSYFIPILLTRFQSSYRSLLLLLPLFPLSFIFMLSINHNSLLFVVFALIGLSYGAVSTFDSVLVSDAANQNQQGEVLGFRWGLRMLGDSVNCIFGGFLLSYSTKLPIVAAIVFAGLSFMLYLGANIYPKSLYLAPKNSQY